MSVLMHASRQWAERPADQRFNSLVDLHNAVTRYHNMTIEAPETDLKSVTFSTDMDDNGNVEPVLVGANGARANFTNYSFGQMARIVGAPAGYLRKLPVGLATANLNAGIRVLPIEAPKANLLLAQNGRLTLRAATSERYTRIWNSDVTSRLLTLPKEWQPAPAAFDGSRGLYASDRDMFAFMVDNDRRIFEKDVNGGFGRGFFISNSEVGDASFRITTFLYQYVCGNHMVWGAHGVTDIRIPHVGNADERAFGKLTIELRKYANSSAAEQEAKIESMRRMTIGATKDEVLDALFDKGIARKVAVEAYDRAVEHEDWYGAPNTVFGITSGITEVARDLPHADERVELERKAGKIMQIAF